MSDEEPELSDDQRALQRIYGPYLQRRLDPPVLVWTLPVEVVESRAVRFAFPVTPPKVNDPINPKETP